MNEKNINLDLVLDELNKINSKFEEMNQTFILKFNKFEQKIINLDNKISHIENKLKSSNNTNYTEFDDNEELKELVKDCSINIDKDIVLRALSYRDYRTVIILFKNYYLNENNKFNKYPIKVVGKRTYEYYLNKRWINDPYGHYIKHTVLLNIQTVLIRYNNNDYIKDYDNLIMNQDFIYKLTEDKFSKNYFRHIIDEIKNN